MDTQSGLRPAQARSLHALGVVSPVGPQAAQPVSLTSETLHTKVHSLLSLAMVAAFAAVVGSAAVVAGQERIAAAYMENPGPQHQVTRVAAVSAQPRVLGASTAVPAPVSSLDTKEDFVRYLYRCMLQRPEPDQSGLDFWVGTMASDPDPVNHLYRAFYLAGEFNKNISNSDFVTQVYRCTLFRQPNDPPDNNFFGRDFWAHEMDIGNLDQYGMLGAFLSSIEYNTKILPTLSALPVSVTVPSKPVTISLTASKLSVASGESLYLSWSVANADSGTITFNNGLGAVGSSGNRTVNPTATTTYTLSAGNSLGTVTKSVTITVVSVTPNVSIYSPQPGESWTAGTTHSIAWNSNQPSTVPFSILVSVLPANCNSADCGTSATLISGDANIGLYNWNIPSNYAPGRYIATVSLYTAGVSGQSGVFNVTAPVVNATATPVISPNGGTFTSPQSVTLSDATSGASIRYTIDGSEPTASSALYSAPFIVSTSATVRAKAFASGKPDSASASASFIIGTTEPQAALPVISPAGGTFNAPQPVILSDSTPGAGIHYTLDGSEPAVSSPLYSAPFTVTATLTVKAKAFAAGYKDSGTAVAAFTISPQPPVNHKPIGYLDSVNQTSAVAYGWSYDPDDPAQPVMVHFYIDGLDVAHLAGYVQADQPRADVNQDPVVGAPGDHGFAWSIPAQYQDGKQHTLYAFGIDLTDASGSSNAGLAQSPQTFSSGVILSRPTPFPITADGFVQALHTCILGRAPSDAELTSWKSKFNSEGDVPGLYTAFYAKLEFSSRHLSNADSIHNLYYCVLFRQDDPAVSDKDGFNYWLDQANHGRPWESTLEAFLVSSEFKDGILPKLLALRAVTGQTNLDPRLGVVHVAGSYPKKDGDFLVAGAQDARTLGFQGIEVYMAPEMCGTNRDSNDNIIKPGAYQTLDWCDDRPMFAPGTTARVPNISPQFHSLGELAAHPRYRALFNLDFKNYFITAETINPDRVYPEPADCVAAEMNRINAFNIGAECYKDGFSARQLQSLHDDFYSLVKYLLQTYKNTGKTFVVLSGNELENHFEAGGSYPDWTMNNAVSYLNTISQAFADAKAATSSQGVAVYHGCEFAVINDKTFQGGRDGVNNVVPRTHCDLYGWSSWDYPVYHPTDDNYITKGLEHYASKAPDSPVFGNHNVFLSEFGDPEGYHPFEQNIKVLNNGIDKALAWGVPYVNYWALYAGCEGNYPATSESQCRGFWLRKPAADPSQLGPLSDIYTQVFAPRKEH
jgi:chitobiase/beta-hexosaminidase-like protein/uncharacterized protein DUF4214